MTTGRPSRFAGLNGHVERGIVEDAHCPLHPVDDASARPCAARRRAAPARGAAPIRRQAVAAAGSRRGSRAKGIGLSLYSAWPAARVVRLVLRDSKRGCGVLMARTQGWVDARGRTVPGSVCQDAPGLYQVSPPYPPQVRTFWRCSAFSKGCGGCVALKSS